MVDPIFFTLDTICAPWKWHPGQVPSFAPPPCYAHVIDHLYADDHVVELTHSMTCYHKHQQYNLGKGGCKYTKNQP